MPPLYSHTQKARSALWTIGLILIGAGLFVIVLVGRAPNAPPYLLVLGALPLVIALLILAAFSSMHIEVDAEAVRWHFGKGAPSWSVALADIRATADVRNPWYYGLGIHLTPRGMLYNISGARAVEITRTNGTRVRLGTDEPEALIAAIDHARRPDSRSSQS